MTKVSHPPTSTKTHTSCLYKLIWDVFTLIFKALVRMRSIKELQGQDPETHQLLAKIISVKYCCFFLCGEEDQRDFKKFANGSLKSALHNSLRARKVHCFALLTNIT